MGLFPFPSVTIGIFCRAWLVFWSGMLKTVKQEEPITRSRFIECPQCKARGFKLKRIVQVGRCRSCHESYRIVIMFVKTGTKRKKETPLTVTVENKETSPESTLPSWEIPSDSSLFGSSGETSPSSGTDAFGWETTTQDKPSETRSDQ